MITCKEVVKKYGPIFSQGDVLRANDTAPEVVLNVLGACQANDLTHRASYQVVKCATLDNADPFEFVDQESPAQKPRKKVEYVKCEFEHAWEAVKLIEGGEILFRDAGGNDVISIRDAITRFITYGEFYRRTEVDIDWRDEVATQTGWTVQQIDDWSKLFDEQGVSLIKLCHLVASLTPKP